MAQIGARVGAILSADDKNVYLLGYGVYEADEIPSADAVGMGKMLREAKIPNPKIKLDNGKVVWGCECWWGPEEMIKTQVEASKESGRVVVETDIDEVRKEISTES